MHVAALAGAAALLPRLRTHWSGTVLAVFQPAEELVAGARGMVEDGLFGRGGHGSRPEATVDPVLLAASVVARPRGVVAREVPATETAVVTVGRLQAGTKENTVPDTATVIAAFQESGHDQLPSSHSPEFAPVVQPTLTTGVEALTVAALGRLGG